MFSLKKIVLIVCAFVVSACTQTADVAQANNQANNYVETGALFGKTWQLVAMNNETVSYQKQWPKPSINFDEQKNTVSGNSGCNRFFGGYIIDGQTLEFAPLASTKMLCQGHANLEMDFLKALSQVNTYKISSGQLLLLGENQQVLLTFNQLVAQ
ncbi:META domain-containing protein [Thalassotalea sp. PLHSN55]|uniref:META domain-containing protein n=1 Tax=Thalassotalea sp. PLHSN55 TaxID=3435888 RepID=UPI003F84AFCC